MERIPNSFASREASLGPRVVIVWARLESPPLAQRRMNQPDDDRDDDDDRHRRRDENEVAATGGHGERRASFRTNDDEMATIMAISRARTRRALFASLT